MLLIKEITYALDGARENVYKTMGDVKITGARVFTLEVIFEEVLNGKKCRNRMASWEIL